MPKLTTPTEADKAQAQTERERRQKARERKQAATRSRREWKGMIRDLETAVGQRAAIEKANRWRILDACGLCGVAIPPPPTDSMGRLVGTVLPVHELSPGRFGLPHGITTALCGNCAKATEAGDRKGLLRRLEAHRPGYGAAELHPAQLVAVTFAGAVLAAREAGADDPTPPGTPFGHLPDRLEDLDLPAAPTPPAPRPPDPRLVDSGCLICGTDRLRVGGFAPDPLSRFDARWFGLDRAGGDVRGRLCADCDGTHRGVGDMFYTGRHYGLPAAVAVTVRLRMQRLRPEAWPAKGEGELSLAALARYTFAGAVVLAREVGTDEPEPGEPFGWLP